MHDEHRIAAAGGRAADDRRRLRRDESRGAGARTGRRARARVRVDGDRRGRGRPRAGRGDAGRVRAHAVPDHDAGERASRRRGHVAAAPRPGRVVLRRHRHRARVRRRGRRSRRRDRRRRRAPQRGPDRRRHARAGPARPAARGQRQPGRGAPCALRRADRPPAARRLSAAGPRAAVPRSGTRPATAGRRMSAMSGSAEPGRWAAHPWRARTLRLLVYAVPIAASIAFVRGTTAITGTPTGSLAVFLLWWLALSVAATAVVSGVCALSRRLLPLGALLELSLVFPDEAPSRFRVALSTGTVESLEERLRRLPADGDGASTQEAAEILLRLVAALDVHDPLTRGHADRVRAYASLLGKEIGLRGDDLDRLNWAALLHDIGKLRVDRDILSAPGRPTPLQWQSLRRHPLEGEALAAPLRAWLGSWWDAIGYHHERWDGKGYCRGLAGEEIPLAGRIVAIADVFDVITSARSYKEASGAAAGRAELARCAGSHFDPRLVRAFLNISLGKMRLVIGPLSWLSDAPLLGRLPLTPSVGAAFGGLAALVTTAAAGAFGSQATARS